MSESHWRRSLFPFRKRSMRLLVTKPLVKADAMDLNQIRQIKAFFLVFERTKFRPKLNLRQRFWKGLGSPSIDVSEL